MATVNGYLFFDLDGTLADAMPANTNCFCRALQPDGIPSSTARAVYRATIGRPLSDQFASALGVNALSGQQHQLLIDRFATCLADATVHAFPDVRSVLAQLVASGWILCVSSGGPTVTVLRRLKRLRLSKPFAVVMGSDYGGPTKGMQHVVEAACKLKVDPAEIIARGAFVGDSPYDMTVARAAGLLALGRVGTFTASELRSAGAMEAWCDLYSLPAYLDSAATQARWAKKMKR